MPPKLTKTVILTASLALSLGACAREQDPNNAGYFSGIGNVVDGTYDRRVAEREQDAQRAEQMAREMQARASAAQAEARATSASLTAAEARNRAQKAELARLDIALREASRNRAARAEDLAAARVRLDAAKRRQQQLEQHPPASQSQRSAEQAAIDAEMKALDDMILHSTRAE